MLGEGKGDKCSETLFGENESVWKGNLYQSRPAQIWFFFIEISMYNRPGI